jgi:cytochrome c oxidase subunit 1
MISIPTGVLFFNWLATLYKGKIRFEVPMLFALGFIAMFLIGGIDGVWTASPAVDFALTDTYWVVSHIHYVLFGGTVFGVMAGMYYWFPKMTGRYLNRRLGLWHFWIQLIGFNMTFFPMHLLGLKGMPRRIADYAANRGWTTLNTISSIGALIIALSILIFLVNVVISLRKPADAPDDPWEANTLEWATTSPPPVYNFERLPTVRSNRPLFDARAAAAGSPEATS